jgi:patatin-like phospholipase/acyl hydrolase
MSVWGHLATRFEGKENEKHKILALDGGGIRGILTLEVLARMEEMLGRSHRWRSGVQALRFL